MIARPPGFSTRRASASIRHGSRVCSSTAMSSTTSNELVRKRQLVPVGAEEQAALARPRVRRASSRRPSAPDACPCRRTSSPRRSPTSRMSRARDAGHARRALRRDTAGRSSRRRRSPATRGPRLRRRTRGARARTVYALCAAARSVGGSHAGAGCRPRSDTDGAKPNRSRIVGSAERNWMYSSVWPSCRTVTSTSSARAIARTTSLT